MIIEVEGFMLGKILEISNNKIVVENNDTIKNVINFYVKITSQERIFIGEIKAFNQKEITISLLGELEGEKFKYGLSHKPSFDGKIEFLKPEELNILFGAINYSAHTHLYFGKSAIYEEYPIYLNINNLFANHLVVLGNTGSGKSCGMARILQNLFYKNDAQAINSTFFIIDAYGEYKNAFSMIDYVNKDLSYKNYTTDLDSHDEKLLIPLWLLSVDDLSLLLDVTNRNQISIIEKALQLVNVFLRQDDKVMEYKNSIIAQALLDIFINGNTPAQIRDQVFSVLTRYNTEELNLDTPIYMPGYTRPLKQCLMIDETGKIREMELVITFLNKYILEDMQLSLPDGSYKYTLKDLLYAFDFALIEQGVLNDKNVYSLAHSLRVKLASILNSKDSKFFELPKYYTKREFMELITHKEGKKVQVVNLNLQGIDDRLAKNVAKVYAKMIFDFNKDNHHDNNNLPIHIILEEAHRYVQNDHDVDILGYNIFERIAKEGRKYAVILSLISQRPSELSQTVLSQCSNFIVFRITHPADIDYIKSMIPYVDEEMIEKIKNLPTGHALGFGNAIVLPTITKLDEATPGPTSQSCDIANTWFQ